MCAGRENIRKGKDGFIFNFYSEQFMIWRSEYSEIVQMLSLGIQEKAPEQKLPGVSPYMLSPVFSLFPSRIFLCYSSLSVAVTAQLSVLA